MEPLLVVERKVSCQMLARVPHALVVSQIDLLIFDAVPQPLHTHVIQGAAAAIRTDSDSSFLQPRRECLSRELDPLVCIEDLRASLLERPLQRLDTT